MKPFLYIYIKTPTTMANKDNEHQIYYVIAITNILWNWGFLTT